MKKQKHNNATKIFTGSELQITSEERQHLGLVIGYETLKVSYRNTKGNQRNIKRKTLQSTTNRIQN